MTFSSRFTAIFSSQDTRSVQCSNTDYFIKLPLVSWVTVQTTYLWPWQLFFLSPWKTSLVSAFTHSLCVSGRRIMFLLGSWAVPTLQLLLPQPRWSSLARELRQRDRHEQASLTWASTWSPESAKAYRGAGKTAEGRGAIFVNFISSLCRHL